MSRIFAKRSSAIIESFRHAFFMYTTAKPCVRACVRICLYVTINLKELINE